MPDPVFFQRSRAANYAIKKGWRSFRTFQPVPSDKKCWSVKEMPMGPGIEFAEIWSEGKDYVAWVEITDAAIPILIVTCFREEILEKLPNPLTMEPITPELWERNRSEYPRPSLPPLPKKQGATGAAAPVTPKPAQEPRSSPVAQRSTAGSPVTICREEFATCNGDRKAYVAAVLARGVNKNTANTQWWYLNNPK